MYQFTACRAVSRTIDPCRFVPSTRDIASRTVSRRQEPTRPDVSCKSCGRGFDSRTRLSQSTSVRGSTAPALEKREASCTRVRHMRSCSASPRSHRRGSVRHRPAQSAPRAPQRHRRHTGTMRGPTATRRQVTRRTRRCAASSEAPGTSRGCILICMQSTSVRIDRTTHDELRRLAAELKPTIGNTVALAVRALRQDRVGSDLVTPLRNHETDWLDAGLG
jgi:hypothetical protein